MTKRQVDRVVSACFGEIFATLALTILAFSMKSFDTFARSAVLRFQSIFVFSVSMVLATTSVHAQSLEQMKYNHDGLAVDLGVGLWAWPVPMDADKDGDLDLLVSCPDKPSNGIWFFENVDGDTKKNPLPIFRPGRKISSTVHYVMPSYVGNKVRVLSPGVEYLNFGEQGTSLKQTLPIPA